jgi:hypothetical protein
MQPAIDQWRLLWAAILVAAPLIAGYRLAKKIQRPPAAMADAILIAYLVQYVAVGLAGLLGILTPLFLIIIALAICAGLWISAGFIPPRATASPIPRSDRRWTLFTCLFAIGFLAALIYWEKLNPPMATDALVYHLPAAVLWLQKKRIALFQTWFFNPANTYSPLAGSTFITWLLAPLGNDALARFVQVGPWFLILISIIEIATSAGASLPAAALAALAAVLARPFIGEAVIPKDDLFVAAFFLAAVAALARDRMNSRFGWLRLGIAVGLMLATKYTALMAAPILLLAADAPRRAGWRWRQWAGAILAVALLAGPWYLRNLLEWGNPLFPVKFDLVGFRLRGLIARIEVPELRSAAGLWNVLTGGYYGLPAILFSFLLAAWLLSLIRLRNNLPRDPLQRLTVLGPILGLLIFAFCSPQPEVRFVLPSLALLFVLCGMAASRKWAVALSGVAVLMAIATSFSSANAGQIATFSLWAIVTALIGLLIHWLEADALRLRRPILSGIAIAAVLAIVGYGWTDYLHEYQTARMDIWKSVYPTQAAAWDFVDRNLPQAATIAYSNQFMIYPLYGFECRRNVIYAPVRAGASVSNLAFPAQISDADLNLAAARSANAPSSESAWLDNLRACRAEYFIVGLGDGAPEVGWAETDRAEFTRIFINSDLAIYRISRIH